MFVMLLVLLYFLKYTTTKVKEGVKPLKKLKTHKRVLSFLLFFFYPTNVDANLKLVHKIRKGILLTSRKKYPKTRFRL
jgi:hypothetical protein